MKLFISWSGENSKRIAYALRDWLPMVLQAVKPWMSSYDIEKGNRWHSEMTFQLQESSFGILCLTPDNLNAPWVLFEAGALSKSIDGSHVVPYLYGFDPSELRGPLVQFQAALANKEDTKRLIFSLNRVLEENRLAESVLDEIYEIMWPRLEAKLREIPVSTTTTTATTTTTSSTTTTTAPPPVRPREETIEDIVKALLTQHIQQEQPPTQTPAKDYVFIVHGHDDATKEKVARFIEKIGMETVILHEKPDRGQTIIEKFESYSEVGYAIVLLTADDFGGSKSDIDRSQPRARQNVIFELGYFIAKLGRNRVGVLYQDPVEIPSDYSGVIYIALDKEETWKFRLARELKASGMLVDLNKVI